MKPYYQDEWVTIYHGDCRELLPSLEKVDLVLTDPPYGINYQSARRTEWQRKEKIVGDNEFPLWLFDILHPTSALFVFCRWDILVKLPPPKSFIVWDKIIHGMGDLYHEYARQWEGIAFYPSESHQFTKRPQDILRCQRVTSDKLLHPNEKPVDLMRQLIIPNKGNVILDPFVGAGATLLASKSLNRKCIGIEIEEKYCEIAAKRCSQSVMRLDI